jgi:hypothetical protein
MPTDAFLPLVERQAARAAIEELVRSAGSQAAAGHALGLSQNAVNKAVKYTRVGPNIMRALLEYMKIDTKELLARYGGAAPSAERARAVHPPTAAPLSFKDEAIMAGVRYGGVREEVARAIADKYEAVLADAPLIEWVETMLSKIQTQHHRPAREEKAATRREKAQQRILRNLNDANAAPAAKPAAPAAVQPKKRASR